MIMSNPAPTHPAPAHSHFIYAQSKDSIHPEIRLLKVCDEEDCKFFNLESEYKDWDALTCPYLYLTSFTVIDIRCLKCTRSRKIDLKQEVKVLEAIDSLEGKNNDN